MKSKLLHLAEGKIFYVFKDMQKRKTHLPSAVMRMRQTSVGVPTKEPRTPAVRPMLILARKEGGLPDCERELMYSKRLV